MGGSAYLFGLPTSTPEAGQLLPGYEATAAFTSTIEARSESAGPVRRQLSEKQGLRRGQLRTAGATGTANERPPLPTTYFCFVREFKQSYPKIPTDTEADIPLV